MIKNDEAKWIFFMADHGKQNGIKNFFKLIIWAGIDKNGTQCLKYFWLDMDKSSHISWDYAATIKKLVTKLKEAGLNLSDIKFFVIIGDSGGGGAVQHTHPLLKAI